MCIHILKFNKTLTSRQNSMNKFSGNCDISKFLGNTNIREQLLVDIQHDPTKDIFFL